jgi:hypothetical protein
MLTDREKEDQEKAKFYFDAVLKLEDISQKSYERVNAKINIFIGVLSTVIPILTGLGYIVLSNIVSISFFVFYIASLGILVSALATCVHLLSPKWFTCIDINQYMRTYDKNNFSYLITKIAAKWDSIVKKNISAVNTAFVGLQMTVKLIVIGLAALVFAFLQLGIEYYLLPTLSLSPFNAILSPNGWRLLSLIISLTAFLVIIALEFRKRSPDTQTVVETESSRNETSTVPVEHIAPHRPNADKVFDVCIVLLTVLAAAELAYVSFLFSTDATNNLGQVNYFFRVTTIGTIILLIIWIIASVSPQISGVLEVPSWLALRRWFKQFCWNFFGNLFIFEITAFVFFAIDNSALLSLIAINEGSFAVLFFTFPAVYYYWRKDNQNVTGKRMLIPVIEHIVTFLLALGVLALIVAYSNATPLPNFTP